MLYLDTSLVVSAISNEIATPRVQQWLRHQSDELLISYWTVTELSSAMAMKLRTGDITVDRRRRAFAKFEELRADNFTLLRVTSAHFKVAATFADRHELSVRANDALHLAIAAAQGATVCTLDQRLAVAGPELGVPTQLLT